MELEYHNQQGVSIALLCVCISHENSAGTAFKKPLHFGVKYIIIESQKIITKIE